MLDACRYPVFRSTGSAAQLESDARASASASSVGDPPASGQSGRTESDEPHAKMQQALAMAARVETEDEKEDEKEDERDAVGVDKTG